MSRGFRNIIVPVYPLVHAAITIQRAIELADDERAVIHVVEVHNHYLALQHNILLTAGFIRKENKNWEQQFRAHTNIQFAAGIVKGTSIPAAIAEKALAEKADIIVMGCNSGWGFIRGKTFASTIATTTGIPVFSAKKNKSNTTSVVVPMQQEVQQGLLEKISVLSKKNKLDVHLVSYREQQPDGQEEGGSLAVLQAYQWLKSYINCPVEYSVVSGGNKIKAVNNYLHQLQNDVVLL